MTKFNKIIFWQPTISPHYVPILKELDNYYDEVVLVIERKQRAERKEQGWDIPDTGPIRVIPLSSTNNMKVFVKEDNFYTLHIFSGTRAYPLIWPVLKFASRKNAHFAILGETRDWHGIKGILRIAISTLDSMRIRSNINFVLAKGEVGLWWYKLVGYPIEKIYEWAYFVDKFHVSSINKKDDDTIRFIYVGRLSKEKGIDWLLRSFQNINNNSNSNIELHIVGDGPLKSHCLKLKEKITKCKVIFHGKVPMKVIGQHYQNKDYLLLPSVGKDGWGAVVNEALQYGIHCIVSKNCGSSSVLKNRSIGTVIDPKIRSSLIDIITNIAINNIKPSKEQKSIIKRFANKLSSQSGAEYLQSIIEHAFERSLIRPVPPWKEGNI